uniref:Uncharacterized protein n=1 Tax=Desulfobacca acetoxidans TaxID=60893 RepID=A0A7V4LCH7_9BACT
MKIWHSLLAAGLILGFALPGGAAPQDSGIPPMLEGPRPLTSTDAKTEPRPPAEVKPPVAAAPQPGKTRVAGKAKSPKVGAPKTGSAAKPPKKSAKKKTKTSKAAITSATTPR